MDNYLNLNSFLKFGYFLDYKCPYKLHLPEKIKRPYKDLPENVLVNLGVEKFKKAIQNNFKPGRHNIVPLSGGLDSRALLAGLLELTEAKNIITFTFGTPGSLDFDIAKVIAAKAGVKHYAFNLADYEFTYDELIETSKRIDHQTVLFHHFPLRGTDSLCKGNVVWSGAVIDVFFGRHFHLKKGDTLLEAKGNFAHENRYLRDIDISSLHDNELYGLIEFDQNVSSEIMYEHVLDLLNRQLKYIAPHVMPKGYDYAVLFYDEELTQFSFDIDQKYVDHQYLYKKILLQAFPDFFSIATKSNYGLPLRAGKMRKLYSRYKNSSLRSLSNNFSFIVNPYINYADYGYGIRHRASLNTIVYESIQLLKSRKIVPWIDIDGLWEKHISNKARNGNVLMILASLEIHLQAGKVL